MMIDFATKKVFFKKTWVFLSIGIILLFIVFPIYLHLSAFDDWDISIYSYFKVTNQVDSVATVKHEKKILITTFVVKQNSEVNPLFECTPHFSLCVLAPCSRPLFLRC